MAVDLRGGPNARKAPPYDINSLRFMNYPMQTGIAPDPIETLNNPKAVFRGIAELAGAETAEASAWRYGSCLLIELPQALGQPFLDGYAFCLQKKKPPR